MANTSKRSESHRSREKLPCNRHYRYFDPAQGCPDCLREQGHAQRRSAMAADSVIQPISTEWAMDVDGLFVKSMLVPKKHTDIPQHSHVYDHVSMLATGRIFVYKDGVFDAEYIAPHPIVIKAGIKHRFTTLEDNTLILCIHHAPGGDVKIAAEHHVDDFER